MPPDYNTITEGILRLIGRDEGLLEQFAKGLGITTDELGEYIDTVEFPVIGKKDKHTV